MGKPKFEYKTVELKNLLSFIDKIRVKELNKMGEEGWELISTYGEEAIFKREKTAENTSSNDFTQQYESR